MFRSVLLSALLLAGCQSVAPVVAKKSRTVGASVYGLGEKLSSHTASGARFRPSALAVAHKTLPFGTRLRLCYTRCVGNVIVNDRGPFVRGRDIDMTPAVANRIGFPGTGVITYTQE